VDNLSGAPVQVQSHYAKVYRALVEAEGTLGNLRLDFIRQPAGLAYAYAFAAAAAPGQQIDPAARYIEQPGQITDQMIVRLAINRWGGNLDFQAFAVCAR
jgi:hypothetical protein